ncbi:hypothetical protein K504DRAFT_151912 [Pleomassaria siparia CBS 279.74]|uniref:Uncharacterized protein n=1 Tax=Pleomassaria siparia CBS 279.74 TaxID=1314801 RepID=A0A6G1KMW0_9PLEO|nr:hypothetical protein K504DRAFT_151912 [Pleomassaria siparia CBS 279.74]
MYVTGKRQCPSYPQRTPRASQHRSSAANVDTITQSPETPASMSTTSAPVKTSVRARVKTGLERIWRWMRKAPSVVASELCFCCCCCCCCEGTDTENGDVNERTALLEDPDADPDARLRQQAQQARQEQPGPNSSLDGAAPGPSTSSMTAPSSSSIHNDETLVESSPARSDVTARYNPIQEANQAQTSGSGTGPDSYYHMPPQSSPTGSVVTVMYSPMRTPTPDSTANVGPLSIRSPSASPAPSNATVLVHRVFRCNHVHFDLLNENESEECNLVFRTQEELDNHMRNCSCMSGALPVRVDAREAASKQVFHR